MALVTEDGTGKTDAESYISVADADAYHVAYTGSADWSGAETVDKELALRQAAQWLDARFRESWRGLRYSADQALSWPRDSVEVDGVILDRATLPTELEQAAAELARKVVKGDTIFIDMTDEGTVKSKSFRVGPLSKVTTYAGGSRGIKRYRLVEELVAGLTMAGNQLERA